MSNQSGNFCPSPAAHDVIAAPVVPGASPPQIDAPEVRRSSLRVFGRYNKLPKRFEDDYERESKVLGSGMTGPVFLATCKSTGAKHAVKCYKMPGAGSQELQEFENEAEIFLKMDHPHVVDLIDVFESDSHIHLVMEYLTGGELFQRLQAEGKFIEKDAQDAAWQMLLSISYLHHSHVVHRDLKLENYMYESEGSSHLKLIDFGLSKVFDPNTTMSQSLGSLAYAAPEVLRGSYTKQCDLWSYGVIVFVLLFGYMPFRGSDKQKIAGIKSGRFLKKPGRWDRVSEAARDFVMSLLVVDGDKRLTAESALKHEWIATRDELGWGHRQVDRATVDALIKFGKDSPLRRACMAVMACSLKKEERAGIRDVFLEMDKDRSGVISLCEFRQALEEGLSMRGEIAGEIFAAIDINNSGSIQYEEFLAAVTCTRMRVNDDALKTTFKRFDVDNSGGITAEELRAVLGDSFEGRSVELLMEDAHAHDGIISLEEFASFLKGSDGERRLSDDATRIIDEQVASQADYDKKIDGGRDTSTASLVSSARGDTLLSSRTCPPWELREYPLVPITQRTSRSCRTCDQRMDGTCSVQ